MTLKDRFLRYVRINTRSNDEITDRTPSTEVQWDLARALEKELKELGMQDVKLNEKCIVTAILQDENKIYPVSAYLEGEYGVQGIYSGVPAMLNRHGVSEIGVFNLTPAELAQFQQAAAVLKTHIQKLDPR
mgnify:CR=1 FL=1